MRPTPQTQRVPLNRQTWLRFLVAVRSVTRSEVGGKAKLLFVGLILMLFAMNGLNVVNSYVGRDFMTAIAERSRTGFLTLAIAYIGVFLASTFVAVIYRFTEERLGLLWRGWLTNRLLVAYLHHPTVYRLSDRLIANGEIANPDQRIADDVKTFTATTLSFVLLILNGTFTAVAFSGVMWTISPLLFIVGVLYAGAGSLLTIRFGHSLVGLNYAQLDHEANFRAGLVTLRENAEAVSVARYERHERSRLTARLDALLGNARHIIAVNRNLNFFTTGYNYMIQIIPALIVAPMFIRGSVEFGVITQSAMAFSQLLGAFSLIITQFQSISSFTAVVARLGSLAEAIEQAQAVTILSLETCGHKRPTADCPICLAHGAALPAPPTIMIAEEARRLAFEALNLRSLDETVLLKDLSLSIPLPARVLVHGANDAAKVALFRVTAGIWETGSGRVIRPPEEQIQFLSERPYLPPGTLREVLVPPGYDVNDAAEKVLQLAHTFDLTGMLARAGGIDTEQDWNGLLSLGEQQLFAVVRLILAAPELAFLDRPQTVLSSKRIELVLSTLHAHAISYVMIGERNGYAFDGELELHADATWTWAAR